MAFIKDKTKQEVMQILFQNSVEILRATHDDLITSLISGHTTTDIKSNPTLRYHMQDISAKVRRGKQPSIYYQQLVDVNGTSPNKVEISQIRNKMIFYTRAQPRIAIRTQDFHLFIRQVDKAFGSWQTIEPVEDSENRRCVSKKNKGQRHAIDKHRSIVDRFAKMVMARMSSDGKPLDGQLFSPLAETGHATHWSRLGDHANHRQNSNFPMDLAEAICKVYPEWKKYRIAQYAISPVWRISHATAGELLFSRLLQVYDDDGGGFSFYGAGLKPPRCVQYSYGKLGQMGVG